MGTLAVNIALYKSLPYDSQKDLEPIGLGGTNPMVLVTKKDLPAKTFAEFQDYVKANQKKVQYGMAGIGAASHLGGLMLNSMMKVDVLEIPYKGTGPALNDLVSGQFDYMVDQAVNVLAQINSGNIKALGVSTLKRLPQLPNVPTIDEAGLKGYEVTIWNGFFGPKGMSKDNIAKINDALVKTMADPGIVKRLTELAVDLPSKEEATPDALRTQLKASIDKWVPAVQGRRREAGIGFNRAFCRRDGELGHRAPVLRPPASYPLEAAGCLPRISSSTAIVTLQRTLPLSSRTARAIVRSRQSMSMTPKFGTTCTPPRRLGPGSRMFQ